MREVGTALITIGVQSLNVVVRAHIVREVLGARPWLPIPGACREVPGVVIWSGKAVAVVDLARFHPGLVELEPAGVRPRFIVLESSGSTLVLPADRVGEVWSTHNDNIRPQQLNEFELAAQEVVTDEQSLPLFEPELLVARLTAST